MVNCMLCGIYFQRNTALISHNAHQFTVQTLQLQGNEGNSKQVVQILDFCNIRFNVN